MTVYSSHRFCLSFFYIEDVLENNIKHSILWYLKNDMYRNGIKKINTLYYDILIYQHGI